MMLEASRKAAEAAADIMRSFWRAWRAGRLRVVLLAAGLREMGFGQGIPRLARPFTLESWEDL